MRTLLIVVLSLAICPAVKSEVIKSKDADNLFTFEGKFGTAYIEISSATVFVPLNKPVRYFGFTKIVVAQAGKPVESAGDTFNTTPTPTALRIHKRDRTDEDLSIESTNSQIGNSYLFKKPGTVYINMNFNDELAAIPVVVAQIPISIGQDGDDVIKVLGFPSQRKNAFVDWPKTTSIDGIIYSPKAGDADIVEHWYFKDYPGCAVAIGEDGNVSAVHTLSDEAKSDAAMNAALKAPEKASDSKELLMPREAQDQVSKDRESRTWTGKNGNEIKAKYGKYKSPKVELIYSNGKTVEIHLNLLSKEDSDLVRKLAKEDREAKK